METWKKYSALAVALTGSFGLFVAYTEYQHSKHPHHHEKIEYSHLKIREFSELAWTRNFVGCAGNKPYPWKCPDCNLLDSKCWAECKAKLAAKQAA